jgi:hypothetical protein
LVRERRDSPESLGGERLGAQTELPEVDAVGLLEVSEQLVGMISRRNREER